MGQLLSACRYGALFRRKFTLEDAVGSHACSLETSKRVTIAIPLRCHFSYQFFLPIRTFLTNISYQFARKLHPNTEGHLHIDGLKMSKSLKNFVSIQQALSEHTLPDGSKHRTTARQVRLMFLLQKWDRPMTYSDDNVAESKSKEQKFKNFFGMTKAHLRKDWLKGPVGFTAADRALTAFLVKTQEEVHAAICNNFFTAGAIAARCAFFNRNLHSRMPLVPTPVRFKRAGV
jgi:hypothetical protein